MKSNADLPDVLAPSHHLAWLLVSGEDTALELVGGSTCCSWDRTEFPRDRVGLVESVRLFDVFLEWKNE